MIIRTATLDPVIDTDEPPCPVVSGLASGAQRDYEERIVALYWAVSDLNRISLRPDVTVTPRHGVLLDRMLRDIQGIIRTS